MLKSGVFVLEGYEEGDGASTDQGVVMVTLADGTIRKTFGDGTVELVFTDGTIRTTLQDGTVIETLADGTMTLQQPDGTRIIIQPDGTVIKTFPDGTVIETLVDGTIIRTMPNGVVITTTPDGRMVQVLQDGTEVPVTPEQAQELGLRLQTVQAEPGEAGRSGIELPSVAAAVAGWGVASSRKETGEETRAKVDREAFLRLDRERELRRYRRWRNGCLEAPSQGSPRGRNRKEASRKGFPGFNFIHRRDHGAEDG
jgi:hypothetical protein